MESIVWIDSNLSLPKPRYCHDITKDIIAGCCWYYQMNFNIWVYLIDRDEMVKIKLTPGDIINHSGGDDEFRYQMSWFIDCENNRAVQRCKFWRDNILVYRGQHVTPHDMQKADKANKYWDMDRPIWYIDWYSDWNEAL